MNLSRNLRLTLFGILYFAQGTMLSYFLTFNILYLGESGYTPADVGIFQAVLVIPFVIKIFLGMLSDAVNLFGLGHRKPYIVIGLVGQAVFIVILPNISIAEGLGTFAVLAFMASFSMALYDTCTDGLALDTTPENERGVVQGVMNGARAAGVLVMLLVGGWMAENIGWSGVFYAVAILAVIPLIFVLRIKEDPTRMLRQPFTWSAFKAFRSGAVLLVAAMGFIYSISLDGVLTFLSDNLRDALQVSIGNIGMLVALSMVGRIVGSLTNSYVTDRIGHKQSVYVAIAITTLGCVGLALGGGVTLIAIFGFIFGLAYGYYASVFAAVAMDLSDSHISASMFAIFMMFINIGTVGGQAIGGVLTESIGFKMMVLVMGAINLLNIFLVKGIFRGRTGEAGAVEA
jgi:PAT family beta-lactamase induction signal transducer AmpG